MHIHRTKLVFFAVLLLSACTKQAQSVSPTVTIPPPSATVVVPTEAPAESPTEISSNTDPALFGVISKAEINPLAGNIQEVIFNKIMDGFIASGNIIEYQITYSEVFPSSDGTLIAEITYNVRTTD